jgi:hypothetical protein
MTPCVHIRGAGVFTGNRCNPCSPNPMSGGAPCYQAPRPLGVSGYEFGSFTDRLGEPVVVTLDLQDGPSWALQAVGASTFTNGDEGSHDVLLTLEVYKAGEYTQLLPTAIVSQSQVSTISSDDSLAVTAALGARLGRGVYDIVLHRGLATSVTATGGLTVLAVPTYFPSA